ncbi:MAG: hypothetical protein WA091_01995 [Minisyncoccales bacterium]
MKKIHHAAIGKCIKCGTFLSIDDMTTKCCPTCGHSVTREETFGFKERARGIWEKISWIDPSGNWTENKPIRGFTIGGYYVTDE